ncbi:MAG: Ig-like domain repeat protein [Nocardioidaceae bacterium]|nr:Ig-like domain repeat protein [Nocardioidaceae bacterium]
MRRLTAAFTALLIALGLTLAVTGPANADWTAPANGAVLRGSSVTLSASGGYDNSTLGHCGWFGGSGGSTRFRLINASNAIVFEQFWNTGGSRSTTIDTRSYPNGSYTLRDIEEVRQNSGFAGLGCKTDTNTYNRSVTIDNFVSVAYSGDTTAPRNTSIPVSATVTDGTLGNPVAGITVTFVLDGAGGSVSAVTNGSGVASASLPVLGNARTATLTIATLNTSFWRGGTTSRTFEVTKNDTTTTVATPATVVHGQPISFSASVVAANGTGTPTGTLQFKVDGNNFGAPVAMSSGAATTPPTTALSTGNHTVTAVYGGDSGFLGSTSAGKTATIDKASTTTDLNADVSPTHYGQPVTFTAIVTAVAPGAGDPTGGVQFNIDGQPFGTAVPIGGGNQALLTVSNLSAGNHDVEAVYNGDADFASSTSAQVTQGVDRADTDLALATSDTTAVSGQSLTYTATVTAVAPGAGTPAGQVQFEVDGTPLGGPVTLSGGVATSPSTSLLVGSHHVTANYLGDANFGGSNNAYDQVVGAASTSTALSTSPNPSVFGQPVTLHADVTVDGPGSGDPSGQVKFTVDGTEEYFATVTDGVAETSVSTLAVGDHTVVATFQSSDSNFLNSTSEEATQSVNKAATKTVVSSSSATSVFGQPVTFTATVSVQAPGAGAPAGTITFTDGTTDLATVPVSSATGFEATYTTAGLSVGQHAITATYSGDDSFLTSNGSTTQTVMKAQTSTLVASSNNPAQSGQSTVFTAVVSPVAPGAGNPSGTVLFTVNGLPLGGPRPVVAGLATSPAFSALTPGTYKVQAQYSGDGNFTKSTGLLDQGAGQNVTKGATTTELAATPDPADYNSTVMFTATVKAVAPATGRPSGVVRFWEGGELLGSVSLAPAGTGTASAEFTTASFGPGTHGVRAEYVGNFNFTGSEATTTATVDRVPTVTGVESSANPIAYGDSVTLTAVVSKSLPAAGQPTGSVTFTEGGDVLGTATVSTVDGRQVASVTVAGLHAGAHAVTATYDGDSTFAGSTSSAYTVNVTRQATNVAAGSPSVHDTNRIPTKAGYVRARLTDASGNPLPGRTIAFTNKPTAERPAYLLCNAVTGADGIAECDYTVINIDPSLSGDDLLIDVNGAYDATFAGSADYAPATDRGHLF